MMMMMMMMMMITMEKNSIQQVYVKVLLEQHTWQLVSRRQIRKNETQSRETTYNSNDKQYSK
jgi:hypothetical protein